MKKSLKLTLALLAVFIVLATVLCGCNIFQPTTQNSILSIEKTSSSGLTDIYTVTYQDGTTSQFQVTNGRDGKDGKDGESFGVEELFNAYLKRNPNATFDDFLQTFAVAESNSNATVISKALLSSLKVYTEFTESYSAWPRPQSYYETNIYCGSGVIYKIDEDYTYIVTNFHVVYDSNAATESKLAKKITCYLYGSESAPVATDKQDSSGCTVYDYGAYAIDCQIVGGSASTDLAVLKTPTQSIKALNSQIRAVELADGYVVGQTAIAIGNPEDEGISVTQGIVSVDNEFIQLSVDGTTRSYRSVRIDTPLYSGNSGGGLFDADCKLIGITNAGDKSDQNVNYAIPVSIVKPVVENILYHADGTVKKVIVGVTVSSANSKYVYDEATGRGKIVEDVVIASVTQNSIAHALGLQQGDVIEKLTINGVSYNVSRYFDIGDILYTVRAGDEISFEFKRDNVTVLSTVYTVKSSDLQVV